MTPPKLTKQLTYSDTEQDSPRKDKASPKILNKQEGQAEGEDEEEKKSAASTSFSVDFTSLAHNMGVKGFKSKKKMKRDKRLQGIPEQDEEAIEEEA